MPVWDGTPIDVSVAFPVATGADNNYPVVGIYHGWGGTKILPSSAAAQRWLTKGYAVFSISDRGWGSSCGGASTKLKAPPCELGYIHLMSRAYEVRDVQTLLGKLADEGVINPQAIGATGGSYGGGMSLQLGALKDRVELTNHELIPWESPGGKPMKIAATAPEFPWTDLAQSLQPNGSTLDYVADSTYSGPLKDHRFGIEKNNWNGSLFLAGSLLGYLSPESNNDPEANIRAWHTFNLTGGPYDGKPLAVQQEVQLPYHSPYYANLSEPPAPALMENGWNDDLFPVDETVKYYNKVRATYPNQAMQLFYLDLGHSPRSANGASATSAGDVAKLTAAQNTWFGYYLKGEGAEPAEAKGGVRTITASRACPLTAAGSGVEHAASNWASLAPGEVRFSSAAEQTILAPGTNPANAFTSADACTTQSSAPNASAATYSLGAAPASGFTIDGASTVIAEFSTLGPNDQVIARLYDENVSAKTEQLIGRQTYRPLNVGEGFTKQTFQLHPNSWKVPSGHVVKLELLVKDSTYALNNTSPHSVQVKNLELRVPTTDAPGSAEGLVQAPLPHYLPPGYTLARNVIPAAPSAPVLSSGSNPNANGQFTLSWRPSQAATAPTYTLEHKNASGGWSTVASGLTSAEYTFTSGSPEGEGTWTYRVTESNESSASEPSAASAEVTVDKTAPNPPTGSPDRAPDYAGGGGWYKDTVTVSFTDNGDPLLSDGSPGSGVNAGSIPGPQTFSTDGSHEASGTVSDNVGNVSAPGSATVQVDASAPVVEVSCPEKAHVGESAEATITASDGQSGLAVDPSGKAPIDTSKTGPQTTSATAVDNVGHETTGECTTEVELEFPGAPYVSAGTNPNNTGLFTLSWTGTDPLTNMSLTYILQHHNAATEEWSTVATEIASLEYSFTGGGETEGTWQYRVQGHDSSTEETTAFSPASAPVVVDESAANAPTAAADRAPDYAGKGGWYKDTVKVSFNDNGDPLLADGSAGSGVDLGTLAADVQHRRLARSERHSRRQRRQRLLARDADRAGRRLGAGRGSEMPGTGVDRRNGRESDGHRLRRTVGAGQRPERQLPDQHEHRRGQDGQSHRDRQRRARNRSLVLDARRLHPGDHHQPQRQPDHQSRPGDRADQNRQSERQCRGQARRRAGRRGSDDLRDADSQWRGAVAHLRRQSRQSDCDQQHRLGRDRRRQRRMPVEQIRRSGHDQSQQSRRADRRKRLQRLAESNQQRRRHDGDQQQNRRRTGRQRQHRDGRRHAQRSGRQIENPVGGSRRGTGAPFTRVRSP